MPKRIKPGDIYEIQTSKGLGYLQYLVRHSVYGTLVRVLPGVHQDRPADFSSLVDQPPAFKTFLPLQAMVNEQIVMFVAHHPLAAEDQGFPLFKTGIRDPGTGAVAVWYLWDGEKEWRVDQLTEEQRHYPWRGTWNDTLLIERIEEGWTHEQGT